MTTLHIFGPIVGALGRPLPKYRCEQCDTIHDDEDEARECCAPEISEVYLCPLCRADYGDADDALKCCGYDSDGPPPRPAPAELEAAGQMRLLPSDLPVLCPKHETGGGPCYCEKGNRHPPDNSKYEHRRLPPCNCGDALCPDGPIKL